MAILIIGEEILFLPSEVRTIRLAMKNSKFKMKRKFRMSKITLFLLFLGLFGKISAQNISYKKYEYVGTGTSQYYQYLPMLTGKRVGVVTNHTGIIQKIIHNEDNTTTIENEHLVDFLLTKKVNVIKVFAPEHGFRGTANVGGTRIHPSGKDSGQL